jgi:predicted nucleotidyltransferase
VFEDLLRKIAKALAGRKIPYMIIGGQAVLLYGEPRLTKDIDITLGLDPNRLADVLEFVRDIQLEMLVRDPEAFVTKTFVLPVQEKSSGIRIDLIFSLSEYERMAIARGKKINLAGTEVVYASVEDLLIHKVVAGRPRDLEDARAILLKQKRVDAETIREWLKKMGEAASEDYLGRFEKLLQESKRIRG